MKKLLLCLLLLALNTFGFVDERPNIIPMMADDLGYETVSANGGAPYKTPVLDKLAPKGFAGRLTGDKAYKAHPWAYVDYYGKNRGDMSHFVRDKQFKLYEGGFFYDYIKDPAHANPIKIKTAGKRAKAAHKSLLDPTQFQVNHQKRVRDPRPFHRKGHCESQAAFPNCGQEAYN